VSLNTPSSPIEQTVDESSLEQEESGFSNSTQANKRKSNVSSNRLPKKKRTRQKRVRHDSDFEDDDIDLSGRPVFQHKFHADFSNNSHQINEVEDIAREQEVYDDSDIDSEDVAQENAEDRMCLSIKI